jgi:HK97 family phage major capsid protein
MFYPRESGYTNNAAPVSEGSLKPKSEITFEMITEVVRTIAHLQDISLQMLDDVDFIQSYIEGRMTYGLKLVEEAQLLTGSGTGQNLSGIYTEATAYAPPSGATINGAPAGGANETDLDKLRLAMLQVELAYAFTTGIVLHPTDWASIELLKDTTGQYLFTNPQNTTTARLWGRDVVSTPAMTQGRFLIGDFAAHAQIFDRQDANVAISFENKDNFERNMATIRVEERLALAVYRPEAFVKGVLESAS